MYRISVIYLFLLLFFTGCTSSRQRAGQMTGKADKVTFEYARNIKIDRFPEYIRVRLLNPWKANTVLHTYYLVEKGDESAVPDDGSRIEIPVKRSVVFTTAHANLMEMLHVEEAIVGVADLKYMLIPDVQTRARRQLYYEKERMKDAEKKQELLKGGIMDCGESMKPDIERIVDLKPDAVLLSPFENSGGYGRLDEINVPVIECADYMERSALGRAEWMKFYGLLFGCEEQADSLFNVVERNYKVLRQNAKASKETRSVLPDRKTGSVWYVPGGESSIGLLYKDAGGQYVYADDTHSGSLPMPFETILDRFGQSDFWILSYNGSMNLRQLLAEYQGYETLKSFRTKEVYGCKVDRVPYFEEVSWRPDWLLQDLIQLFHPDLRLAPLRYYHKLAD
ncbi:MAG: ABC transporter substrate-binding protein [Prevotella sp.]|nr:ABC transporter substrate-binding protein [Prevotella sp.]